MSFAGNQYSNYADKVITTKGDIVRGNSTGDRERYGIGSANQILTSISGEPTWQTLSTAGSVLTTQGDVLYHNASGLARLGQSTDGHVLTTKGPSADPVWSAISAGITVNTEFQTWNYGAIPTGTSQNLGANVCGVGQSMTKPSDASGSKIFRVKKMSWVNGDVVDGRTMIGLMVRNQHLGGLSLLAWGNAMTNSGINTEQTNDDMVSTLLPNSSDSGWDTYSLIPFIVTDSATQEYHTYAGGTGTGMALTFDMAGYKCNVSQDNLANSNRQVGLSATFQGFS